MACSIMRSTVAPPPVSPMRMPGVCYAFPMRAWEVDRHGEPAAVLRLVDKPTPEPGPGQMRVRVRATGIGLPDVLMCRGSYPMTPALPFTPGQEVVGDVTAVGSGVELALGTRVMATTLFPTGFGGFAEESLASADG